ncbi:MAG: DNA polymerase [Oscillospiraceae bacterium]|jgi:DNA polymerase|nr:DNA polymerase [Oscillospiraceae bacterium]
MKNLFIDIETFSSANLIKSGLYKYTQSNDFEVLLFGYSIDDSDSDDDTSTGSGGGRDNGREVKVIDLALGEEIPNEILKALEDKSVMKWAHNANFERVCLSKYLRKELDISSWRCTMIWCAYLGLPLSLKTVGEVLRIEKQKISEGKDLIRYFSMPRKSKQSKEGEEENKESRENKEKENKESMENKEGKEKESEKESEKENKWKDRETNQKPERNLPKNNPEKWNKFKDYNRRDVETEIAIYNRLKKFPMPETEWKNYIIDQKINDFGIMLDSDLVKNALSFSEKASSKLIAEIKETTGIENPRSVRQLKIWLSENGLDTDSLGKKDIEGLLKKCKENEKEKEIKEKIRNNLEIEFLQSNKNLNSVNYPLLIKVLKLRQNLAKSSVKKYQAMANCRCEDKRARGLFQFYGANRTGRWAGRLIQLQNLPKTCVQNLVMARELVKTGDYEALSSVYDSVPSVLSELIRTSFIPEKGKKFIVADFSAIEARVISWLAGEKWRNEVFSGHGKIYEASASRMFKVPIDEITKDNPLRQKGKIAELALGYGGSVGALKSMGAIEMGLSPEELQPLVDSWRRANPNIVKLWYGVDRDVMWAVKNKASLFYAGPYSNSFSAPSIGFEYQSGLLMIKLPSGRKLSYVRPRIEPNKFGGRSVTYEGKSTVKDARKMVKSKVIGWARIESYGAKFVENIIQATARDLLCHAMKSLSETGYKIVMHCHDEVVIETEMKTSVDEVCDLMCSPPEWAKSLTLKAEGFECDFEIVKFSYNEFQATESLILL